MLVIAYYIMSNVAYIITSDKRLVLNAKTVFTENQLSPSSISFSLLDAARPSMLQQTLVESIKLRALGHVKIALVSGYGSVTYVSIVTYVQESVLLVSPYA